MRLQKGFTLVEILIVVVILGILAAIVIPQFTNASTEARQNSLKADLQTMRSQIELYKIQHGDELPGVPEKTDAAFVTDMTTPQAYDGKIYGPYMQKIPVNGFTNKSEVTFVDQTALGEDLTVGWNMDSNSGEFHATSGDHLTW